MTGQPLMQPWLFKLAKTNHHTGTSNAAQEQYKIVEYQNHKTFETRRSIREVVGEGPRPLPLAPPPGSILGAAIK